MAVNLQKTEFILSAASPKDFLRDGLPQIAFAGRSNVGKSSVINRLLNRKNFARVGAAPGKTIHINYFKIDGAFYLVDLHGYGYAKVAKGEKERWAKLIDGYFRSGRNIGLVFQLVDIRHKPSQDDLQMIDFLIENEFPFVLILTKKDKLTKTQLAERLEALQTEIPCADQITMIPFSSEKGDGVEEVKAIIEEIAAEYAEDLTEE